MTSAGKEDTDKVLACKGKQVTGEEAKERVREGKDVLCRQSVSKWQWEKEKKYVRSRPMQPFKKTSLIGHLRYLEGVQRHSQITD